MALLCLVEQITWATTFVIKLQNYLTMKKTLFFISIGVITLFLSSCADMTSQDWRDVEQGLNQLNCSLYQVGC